MADTLSRRFFVASGVGAAIGYGLSGRAVSAAESNLYRDAIVIDGLGGPAA